MVAEQVGGGGVAAVVTVSRCRTRWWWWLLIARWWWEQRRERVRSQSARIQLPTARDWFSIFSQLFVLPVPLPLRFPSLHLSPFLFPLTSVCSTVLSLPELLSFLLAPLSSPPSPRLPCFCYHFCTASAAHPLPQRSIKTTRGPRMRKRSRDSIAAAAISRASRHGNHCER